MSSDGCPTKETSSDAVESIVQFGEAAVAPLITAARQGHFYEEDSVLEALRILLEGRPDVVTSGGILPGRIPPAQLSVLPENSIGSDCRVD